MAPEMFKVRDPNKRMIGKQLDMWATGLSFYKMATGYLPFEPVMNQPALRAILQNLVVDYAPIDALQGENVPNFKKLIQGLLDMD